MKQNNQNSLFANCESIGAIISNCNNYRYQLWRIWDPNRPLVLFVMLNPSTADHTKDDPTIRRCTGFAKSWGYGGFYVGNLFAYRSTDPKQLYNAHFPIGDDNYTHLQEMSLKCDKIVLAYGNSHLVKQLITAGHRDCFKEWELFCIDQSADGTPKHPLYLPKHLTPKPISNDHVFGNKR